MEGDFFEIYHYENVQQKWLNLLLGKKKALVLIEARAYFGFDLTKIKMEANKENKTVIISDFPKRQLLSIETDFKYYDKKEGLANPFTASGLTEINNEAKQHIVDKVPSSGLFDEATRQGLETINLIDQLAATINWNVDYSALELPEKTKNSALTGKNTL
ncbi:MAG: putative SPOUT superfamily RNA methylase MTH1 [Patiriisocius sp.]|jgi:predicted SPOUT superfamily RNA methylase MTH1